MWTSDPSTASRSHPGPDLFSSKDALFPSARSLPLLEELPVNTMSGRSSAAPSSASTTSKQEELTKDYCRAGGFPAPVFNIVSDRRGGRTAWSSTVTIRGRNIAARFWYDGQFINNAKEDAAEVALNLLKQLPHAPQSGQSQAGYGRAYAR
ncbi:hypothetical protein UCRPC4_g01304 [Phaeomoniella chlamydospora]|uniref:DRBM domain-containing protein n=1 Tax=Phaeomoniella chlamydospora TaxID=158046 RepID=A0A0G2EY33_PHACM|nr:hypothetical protein UCRPC4_g01304 [Phaeomoniella chlamydospora]